MADSASRASARLGWRLGSPSLPLRRTHPGAAYLWTDAELDPHQSVRIGVGGDLFVFLDPATALAGPSARLAIDAFRLELGWAFGASQDENLGAVELSLGHGSVGLNVLCARWVDASICASALATVGYAYVAAHPNPDATGYDGEGVYGGGALELGGWISTEFVAVAIGVRGGYGYGILVLADGRQIAAIGGGWVGASLAMEWGPF